MVGAFFSLKLDLPELIFQLLREVNTVEDTVSGMPVIEGPPGARQHVWTFVVSEDDAQSTSRDCCHYSNPNITLPRSTPSFLGMMTISVTLGIINLVIMQVSSTLLWDGEGRAPTSNCCEFNAPPCFCKSLPQT